MPITQEHPPQITPLLMLKRYAIEPLATQWSQFKTRIQDSIAFIRKAIDWVKILHNAQIAIEGFNHDGEALVELLLVEFANAGQPEDIPRTVTALMFLEPDILRDWLDAYSPGQFSHYTHPEALEEFEEKYGSLIRRSEEKSKITQSGFTDPHHTGKGKQGFC